MGTDSKTTSPGVKPGDNGGTEAKGAFVRGQRVDSPGHGSVPLAKLNTAEGDPKRWDEMLAPPTPGVGQQDFSVLLSLYSSNPWVYAAANRCATAVSSVRRTYFKTVDGKKVRSKDTNLQKLLETPNPFQTFTDLIELTVIDLKTIGWSWWEKIFDEKPEDTKHIWRLRPDRVKIRPDEERYWKGITFMRKEGKSVDLDPRELVQFRHWSPVNDFFPVSGLFAAQNSIIWELFGRAWNTSFFRNGAASFPEGVFESDQKLDEDIIKRIEERINNKIGHPDVWRSPLILDQGLRYVKTAFTQKDVQFPELMDRGRDETLAALGVPPAMVGVPIAGGLGGFREQRHQFYQNTILPLLRKIESTINRFLAVDGESMEFDLTDILSLIEDIEAMTRTAESEVTRGIRTINEIRSERGLDDVPWGDVWHAPLGLAPVDGSARPNRPEGLGGAPVATGESGHLPEESEERTLRREFWKAAEGKVRRRMAERFAGAYRSAFDKLRRDIERKIEVSITPVSEKSAVDDTVPIIKQEPRFEFTDVFDPVQSTEYQDLIRDTVGPEALRQTKGASRVAARALGVDFRDVTDQDPLFRKTVDSWLRNRAGSTSRTINRAVQDAARLAREDGATPKQAVRRVMAAFDRTVDQRVKDLSVSDATTFASTALQIQAKDTFTHKRWIHLGDARDPSQGSPGESHVSEGFPSGPIVKIDDRFDVPGRKGINRMEFPGDPAGDADVTSNCRCSLEFLSQAEAEAEGF